MSNVYQAQGRWSEAIAAYEQSLTIKRALGDRHGEEITLRNLERVYQAQREKTGFRTFFAAIRRVTESVGQRLKWW
jgi:tetratricopeptide (TPR) repeat protein